MAQLGFAVAGGAAGGYLGGPTGASLGWTAGLVAARALGFGPESEDTEPPRIAQFRIQDSVLSKDLQTVDGTHRVPGELIAVIQVREIANDVDAEKGFFSDPKVETFSYRATWAVFLGDATELPDGYNLVKLFIGAEQQLIFDATNPTGPVQGGGRFRFYPGTFDQDPDPTMQAFLGIENTSARPGECWLMFEDWPVDRSIPPVSAIIAENATEINPTDIFNMPNWTSEPIKMADGTWYDYKTSGLAPEKWSVYDPVTKRLAVIDDEQKLGGNATFGTGDADLLINGYYPFVLGNLWSVLKLDIAARRHTAIGVDTTSPETKEVRIFGVIAGQQKILAYQPLNDSVQSEGFHIFDSNPDPFLPEVYLPDIDRSLPQLPVIYTGETPGIRMKDSILDATGTAWMLGDDESTLWLLRLDPSGFFISEQIDLGLPAGGGALGYESNTNSILIFVWANTTLHRWQIDSQTIEAWMVVPPEAAVADINSRQWWKINVSSQGIAYVSDSTLSSDYSLVVVIDVINMVQLDLLEMKDWIGQQAAGHSYYDEFNHALLTQVGATDLYINYLDRKTYGDVELGAIFDRRLGERNTVLTAGQNLFGSDRTELVPGFKRPKRVPSRQLCDRLLPIYDVDVNEYQGPNGYGVYFPKRGATAVKQLTVADLGARPDGSAWRPPIVWQQLDPNKAPSRVELETADPDANYQSVPGTPATRPIEIVDEEELQKLNIEQLVLTPDENARAASLILRTAENASLKGAWSTTLEHTDIPVAVPLEIDLDGRIHRFTVVSRRNRPGFIEFEGQIDYEWLHTDQPGSVPWEGFTPPIMDVIAAPVIEALDIPLPRTTDGEGLVIHVMVGPRAGLGFKGAAIYKSSDGEDFSEAFTNIPSNGGMTHGRARNALGSAPVGGTDKINTLQVDWADPDASFTSGTIWRLDTGTPLLVESGDSWEMIIAIQADLQADGSYIFSILNRGQRNTELEIEGHLIGDRVLVMDENAMRRGLVSQVDLNTPVWLKAFSSGGTFENQATDLIPTFLGQSLMPKSPYRFAATRDQPTSNDWTVTYFLRDKMFEIWPVPFPGLPITETITEVEFDFTSQGNSFTVGVVPSPNGSVVDFDNRTVVLTLEDQIAHLGGINGRINFEAYQLSEIVGRGKSSGQVAFGDREPLIVLQSGLDVDPPVDATGRHTIVKGAGAIFDNTIFKAGTGSYDLRGNVLNDYLEVANSFDFLFADGAFDMKVSLRWDHQIAGNEDNYIIGVWDELTPALSWRLLIENSRLQFDWSVDGQARTDSIFSPVDTFLADTWYDVEARRDHFGNFGIFLNQSSIVTGSITDSFFASSASLRYGQNQKTSGSKGLNGWIDEIEITKYQ